MRRALFTLGIVGVVCVVGATQPTSTQSPAPAPASAPVPTPAVTTANVAVPTLTADEAAALARATSSKHLAALRLRSEQLAQRAVLDAREGLFREPTAAEAAALAPAGPGTSVEVAVPVGGAAVKTDAGGVSLVVATVGPDGRVAATHSDRGGRHER